jgi:hypothetical protein
MPIFIALLPCPALSSKQSLEEREKTGTRMQRHVLNIPIFIAIRYQREECEDLSF